MASARPAAPLLRRASCLRPRSNRNFPSWLAIPHCHSSPAASTRLAPLSIAASRHHSTSSGSSSSSHSSSSSVSHDEIAHFNALASSWWDPYGPSRLLHQMNPLRHDFIRECVQSGAAAEDTSLSTDDRLPRRYLDVGCGGGIFAESAARLPATESVTAIDPSAEVLAVARAHARRDPLLQTRLRYRQAAVEDISEDAELAGSFDVVSLFEVIEHVATDQQGAFLARCGRLVRPGGWLVGSTMARTWTSWLTTVVAAEDVLGIVPRGTHDWHKYVDAGELQAHFSSSPAASAAAPTATGDTWQSARFQGVAYVPGLGWQVVPGGEKVGNYFFGIQKAPTSSPEIVTEEK